MSKFFFAIVFSSLVAATACAENVQFLRADGQSIVNESGEKVLLRGVGLGNWLLPEGYMWKFGDEADRPRKIEKLVEDLIGPEDAQDFWNEFRRDYITEADVKEIARLGFNSVRPALNSRLFFKEGHPEQRVEEGFELLDNLVKWCKASGIYVIIDMHAAPGGQTGQNIDDSRNNEPELFTSAQNQDALEKLWVLLAQRYANEPAVAGYDLLNEPLPARTGAEARFKSQLEPLYKRLTKAIRKVDPRHMIILEGADWANDWSVFTKPFDSNLVYQFHYYCWDTPSNVKSIQQYLDKRAQLNAPVWVGETGERDATIYWATSAYFEANNIGWALWPWKRLDAENCPVSIKRPSGWQKVVEYSHGGPKPDKKEAQGILNEFLKNIQVENCLPHPEIVNAMLRRAPVRVEAENYAQGGAGVAYHTNEKETSRFYRQTERVPVFVHEPVRRGSGQFVSLSAGDWTVYNVESAGDQLCEIAVRLRAKEKAAEAGLTIDDVPLVVRTQSTDWTVVKVGRAALHAGANHVKWQAQSGKLDLDWIEFKTARPEQRIAAEAGPAGN